MALAAFTPPFLLCAAVEFAIFFTSFVAAAALRIGVEPATKQHLGQAILVAVVMLLAFYYGELYENRGMRRRVELFLRLVEIYTIGTVVIIVLSYAFPSLQVGRGVLGLWVLLASSATMAWRVLFAWAFGRSALCDRVLVLGTGQNARAVAREMLSREPLGYKVLGFLSERQEEVGQRLVNPSVLGTVDRLPQLVQDLGATLIVVAQEDRRQRMPVQELLRCRVSGVRVMEEADLYDRMTGKLLLKYLRPSWLIFSDGFNKPRLLRNSKRVGEVALALALFVLFSPLLLLVAAAVRLSGRGPILYRQTRVGEHGREFPLMKFRTMRVDAEAESGPVWASRDGDPRVTHVGRFLRRCRLDELPQLFNVLRGEMSFVGPRPERPHFVDKLRQVIPFYDERHTVRPGITGWAQVRFPYGSTLEDAEEKLQYDLYYIKHLSLSLDAAILLETVKVALLGRGAR